MNKPIDINGVKPWELPEDIRDLDRVESGRVSLLLSRLAPPPARSQAVDEIPDYLRRVIRPLIDAQILTEYTVGPITRVVFEPKGFPVYAADPLETGRTAINTLAAPLRELREESVHHFTRRPPEQGPQPIWKVNGLLGEPTGFELAAEEGRWVVRAPKP